MIKIQTFPKLLKPAAAAALALLLQPACAHDDARDLDAKPKTLQSIAGDADPAVSPGEAIVRGFLRDEVTRLPIADVNVLFRSRDPSKETAQQTAITNAKGRFTVVMPAGRYQVFTERCDYKPQSADVEAREGFAAQVSLFLTPGGAACR